MISNMQQHSSRRITEIKECENQAKFVQQRINEVETFFGDLCTQLISYTRRTAKLRNNGDEISKLFLDYSVKEKVNRTASTALKRFAEHLGTIEDYRHALVDRLVGKVVNPLAAYGDDIKNVKVNLKNENAARKKEITNFKKVEKSHPSDAMRQQAEAQLHTATVEAARSADKLERSVVEFEAKKLKGLKTILIEYVHIQMLWHAKALETFSEAYNVLQNLREEADLNDFRGTLLRSTANSCPNPPTNLPQQSPSNPAVSKTSERRRSSSKNSPPAQTYGTRTQAAGDTGGPKAVNTKPSTHTNDGDVSSVYSDEEDDDDDEAEIGEAEVGRKGKSLQGKLADNESEEEEEDDEEDEDENEEEEEDDEEDEDEEEETESHPTGQRIHRESSKRGSGASRTNPATKGSQLKSALKVGGSRSNLH